MKAEDVAKRLGGARRAGQDWMARCPTHEDSKASLALKDAGGKLLVRCHAGCEQRVVIAALQHFGLWDQSLAESKGNVQILLGDRDKHDKRIPDPKQDEPSKKSKITATYDYVNEHGELLFQALRFEPKDFRQRAPNGSWSIKGIRRVPYRLPEVIRAVGQGLPVYIVEGERDVHTAEGLGLVATCNPMGADNGTGNKWLPEFAEFFKGARVIVVPDQDDPGRRHAEWVISTLQGKAKSVARVDLPKGKDLTDFVLEHDGTAVDLVDLAKEVAAPAGRFELLSFDQVSAYPPVSWLIKDVMPAQGIGAVYGPSRSGKSFLVLDMLAAVASERESWFGNKIKVHAPVVYLALEGEHGFPQRIKAYLSERGAPTREFRFIFTGLSILVPEDVVALIESIRALGLEHPIVCIDTLNQATPGMDENSSDMGLAIQSMKRIQRETGGLVMIVHHTGKDESKGLRGHSSLLAALDFSIVVTRSEETRSWKSDKLKDGPDDKEFFFGLKTIELGEDEDGDLVSSCVVIEREAGVSLQTKVGEDLEGQAITARLAIEAYRMESPTYANVGAALGCTQKHVEKTVSKNLIKLGLLEKSAGTRSPYRPTDKAIELLSQTGALLPRASQKSDVPVWKRGVERADLDS